MAAYGSLGKITGEEVGEDLVNEIFSKFCMGKIRKQCIKRVSIMFAVHFVNAIEEKKLSELLLEDILRKQ